MSGIFNLELTSDQERPGKLGAPKNRQMFLSVRPGIDQVFTRRRLGPLPSRCMQQLAATRCG